MRLTGAQYITVISTAWKVIREKPFLWLFGIVLTLGSTVPRASYNQPTTDPASQATSAWETLCMTYAQHPNLVFLAVAFALLIIAGVWAIRLAAKGAIFSSLQHLNEKNSRPLRTGWIAGFRSLKKFIVIEAAIVGVLAICFGLLALPIVSLMANNLNESATIITTYALAVFLGIVLTLSFIRTYAQLYVMLGQLRPVESIGIAYALLRDNFLSSLLLLFILTVIELLVSIVVGIVILPIQLSLGHAGGSTLIATLDWLLLLLGPLGIFGILATFEHVAWYQFFHLIATLPPVEIEAVTQESIPETREAPSESISQTKSCL
ncbi:hypothetical protein EPO05_01195 [Patescibacteria group bacterium]|nr:MAG: hypothetical protein EPO05_01195 [Patescibacteria group bacterium]